MQNFEKAAADAEACVKLAPQWSKGYSRLGLARFKLGDLAAAVKAYSSGLKIEPDNDQLKAALDEARARESSGSPSPCSEGRLHVQEVLAGRAGGGEGTRGLSPPLGCSGAGEGGPEAPAEDELGKLPPRCERRLRAVSSATFQKILKRCARPAVWLALSPAAPADANPEMSNLDPV